MPDNPQAPETPQAEAPVTVTEDQFAGAIMSLVVFTLVVCALSFFGGYYLMTTLFGKGG